MTILYMRKNVTMLSIMDRLLWGSEPHPPDGIFGTFLQSQHTVFYNINPL